MIRTELLVIGAGPGGMAAGLAGAGLGLRTLVLDEQPQPGGQIYRPPLEGLPDSVEGRELRVPVPVAPGPSDPAVGHRGLGHLPGQDSGSYHPRQDAAGGLREADHRLRGL